MSVSVQDFGKDHWSLLAYVETCCIDGKGGVGTLDGRKLRCNIERHPMVVSNGFSWRPEWGTRLFGYWDKANCPVPDLLLDYHDDWDCLDDCEAAGYLEILSHVNGFVRMTPNGLQAAAALRAHKSHSGLFATFRLPETPLATSQPNDQSL